MQARPVFRALSSLRLWRTLAVPLALALPPLFWAVDATRRASVTTLGRDQGIFQYVAWALSRGATDYRDVRDVNGPLTHLVHLVFLRLGGADEHRFRWLDLAVTGATFAFVGGCAPGACSRRVPRAFERAAWALAAWVTLSGQYLAYGFWDTAQRETFCDWFLLPSLALQLVAQKAGAASAAHRRNARCPMRLLVVVGALSVIPWFGKPTFALFTCAQIATVWMDRSTAPTPSKSLLAFAIGGAFGAATQLAFLVSWGDPMAYARIQLIDVPGMYRFIWPRAAADIFSTPFFATYAIFAIAGAVVFFALILTGEMPVRTVAVALAPVCALVGVVVQAKGFPYHFHPVTACVHLQWLVFVAWISERAGVARKRWAGARLVPIAVATLISLHVGAELQDSPYIRDPWLLWGAETPDRRATAEYFDHFVRSDFFPTDMREAAAYLRTHTAPGDGVQTYGMDAYILFLSGRMSATPYIYAYDLNADAALAGGTGGRPDAAQADRIREMRDARESDLLQRVRERPPAAFVFIDNSPLLSEVDAWDDFEAHCARTAAWVRAGYRESARFGHDHVWLRVTSATVPPPGG
jgi:hypothetical protein